VNNKHAGKLYVLEGIDGCGKTTQAQLLFERLSVYGPTHLTREPSDGIIGTMIRGLLKKAHVPRAVMLPLMIADRYDSQEEISTLLGEGYSIVCDRYILSTMAYQFTDGNMFFDENLCSDLHRMGYLPQPAATIYIQVSQAEAKRRREGRKSPPELYDGKLKFIQAGYENIVKSRVDINIGLDQNIHVVDGHGEAEEVASRINEIIFGKL